MKFVNLSLVVESKDWPEKNLNIYRVTGRYSYIIESISYSIVRCACNTAVNESTVVMPICRARSEEVIKASDVNKDTVQRCKYSPMYSPDKFALVTSNGKKGSHMYMSPLNR